MTSNRSTPTLDDVAKTAGVSTATVSRCLNSPDRVVRSTREKVLKAVETLRYTPNFGARVMAAKRTLTIGAIIPTMENSIFVRGLQAFQEELQIRALISRGADGLLLIAYDRAPEIYSYLEQQSVPALIAWAYSPLVERLAISFDNHESMKLLAQEVIDRGHHRIGVISAVTKGNDRAADRLAGITDALNDNGLSVDDLPVIQTSYGFDKGEAAIKALMNAPNPPTAVMCGNDVLAAGALRGAKALGLEVPRDISVTGFDDIELAGIVTPSLTTVHVPHGEMGTKAASTQIGLVKGNQSIGPVKLQISVKIRESLGPAPNN